jgi:hypothetical protein
MAHNFGSAGLARTIPRPWGLNDPGNDTEEDELWEKTIYDAGNIALDDEYAKAMGLPRSQRFPWDTSKGIYLINAYHNLHCVVSTTFVPQVSGSPIPHPR